MDVRPVVAPEPIHTCEICHEDGTWPTVYWAPPFWIHQVCLETVVRHFKGE